MAASTASSPRRANDATAKTETITHSGPLNGRRRVDLENVPLMDSVGPGLAGVFKDGTTRSRRIKDPHSAAGGSAELGSGGGWSCWRVRAVSISAVSASQPRKGDVWPAGSWSVPSIGSPGATSITILMWSDEPETLACTCQLCTCGMASGIGEHPRTLARATPERSYA